MSGRVVNVHPAACMCVKRCDWCGREDRRRERALVLAGVARREERAFEQFVFALAWLVTAPLLRWPRSCWDYAGIVLLLVLVVIATVVWRRAVRIRRARDLGA